MSNQGNNTKPFLGVTTLINNYFLLQILTPRFFKLAPVKYNYRFCIRSYDHSK